jgi:hypothetical protein
MSVISANEESTAKEWDIKGCPASETMILSPNAPIRRLCPAASTIAVNICISPFHYDTLTKHIKTGAESKLVTFNLSTQ